MSLFPEWKPKKCESDCDLTAAWRIYNKTKKREEFYCEQHVPPDGTPRIKRLAHVRQHPDDFLEPVEVGL